MGGRGWSGVFAKPRGFVRKASVQPNPQIESGRRTRVGVHTVGNLIGWQGSVALDRPRSLWAIRGLEGSTPAARF